MFESLLSATIFESTKELGKALLRKLQPSDFDKVKEKLLIKLAEKYKRYNIIDRDRLELFIERKNIQTEFDLFRLEYKLPNLAVIEAEFTEEFSTEFEVT